MRTFSDRILEKSWGLHIPSEMLNAHFLDNIRYSKEVKAYLCNS